MKRLFQLAGFLLLGSWVSSTVLAEESSPLDALAGAQPRSPSSGAVLETNVQRQSVAADANSITSIVPASIDCQYTLTQPASQVNPAVILKWANYAVTKTFTYDFQNYNQQFETLKSCYTPAGWESFMEAMKASNNLRATQDEHLFVSASVNGQSQLISSPSNDNQPVWQVRVPVKVTYQNENKEVSQDLYIDLTIKTHYSEPRHLGINQIVATPKSGGNTQVQNAGSHAAPSLDANGYPVR